MNYIQELLTDEAVGGYIVNLTIGWDNDRVAFRGTIRSNLIGEIVDVYSNTLGGVLAELNDQCQEWLKEHDDGEVNA